MAEHPRTRDDLVRLVHDSVVAVAPELEDEIAGLDPGTDLWRELQLDSMDHLPPAGRSPNATTDGC
jgi:hypothetical protein